VKSATFFFWGKLYHLLGLRVLRSFLMSKIASNNYAQ